MNQCPKCESKEIYSKEASKNQAASKFFKGALSALMLNGHICTDCGYVEYYVADEAVLIKLKEEL